MKWLSDIYMIDLIQRAFVKDQSCMYSMSFVKDFLVVAMILWWYGQEATASPLTITPVLKQDFTEMTIFQNTVLLDLMI